MPRVAINYKLGSSVSTVTSAGLGGRGLFPAQNDYRAQPASYQMDVRGIRSHRESDHSARLRMINLLKLSDISTYHQV